MSRSLSLFMACLLTGLTPLTVQAFFEEPYAGSPVYAIGDRLDSSTVTTDSDVEMDWEALIPEDWDPASIFQGLDLDAMDDDDPKVEALYQTYLDRLKEAPLNPAVDGRRVRIAGFVAPLDWAEEGDLKTFLLVPYFGACIHVPPPPVNQIIHVLPDAPLKGDWTMRPVWVTGILTVAVADGGQAGYSLQAESISAYD